MNTDRATPRWVAEKLAEPDAPPSDAERRVIAEVLRCIRRVRHGSILLVIQDGRVIQIDTTDKKRL